MLGRVSSTHRAAVIVKQVCFSLSSLSFPQYDLHSGSASIAKTPSPSSSLQKLRKTHLESSLPTITLVVQSVICKCSSRFNHKVDSLTASSASLDELLLSISHVSPETCRKFLRVSDLRPEKVLEILLGFELGVKNLLYDARIVGSLWEIFKRAADRNEGFKPLPQSCEVIASMLMGARMLREVESLLSTMETQGVLLACDEICSSLIEGYVHAGELERAILMYDRMRGKGLVPSSSCYCALIDILTKEHNADYVLNIYEDLVEMGLGFGDVEAMNFEILIAFLCRHGKIKEARKLLKRMVSTGCLLNEVVLREVADAYCEKKDFDDLLGFFIEMKCVPDVLVGNKIIFSLCSHFGTKRAHSFFWELENLGFRPNEITFGIFIGWSCNQGKLRDAFVYMSEIFSRGLKPDTHSYNALISGLCKVGMEDHAGAILNEMTDNGIKPNLATFTTLLAGYSKARRFNEVKLMMSEMINYGFTFTSPVEDPILKAFSILGFNPSDVKVRRDNDARNYRTEFIDELGNGLYLDTNLDVFEKTLAGILEESLIPDFDLLVTRQCNQKNAKQALLLVDEMVQWGQELSVPVLSELVKLLCESSCYVKAIPGLLDKNLPLFVRLDHETLNLLVQAMSKNGFVDKCRLLLDEMDRRNLPITNATCTALMVGFCKVGRMNDIFHCWDVLRKGSWIPEWKDFVTILNCLCQRRMLEKLLELFSIMLVAKPDKRMQVCDIFLESLCGSGMTDVGHVLVNELLRQHFELNNSIYNHLIKGYFQEKRLSEALMVFHAIQNAKLIISSDTLLQLATTLCQNNRVEDAAALKDTCLRAHSSSSISLYTALINGFCRAGKIAEADTLFTELPSEYVAPNHEIYNALLQGHCQAIDLRTVKGLLCVMIRRRLTFSVRSYSSLLNLMCTKGMLHSACGLKTLMLVESKFSSSITYNILIFYLFKMGKIFLVDAVLEEMAETGQQLDQVGYNFLINGFSICKDLPRSVKYLNTMISKGLKPNNRSLRAVVKYLCRNGHMQDAVELSKQMELRGWVHSSSLQHAFVEGLLSHGKIHEAQRFLGRIQEKDLMPSMINYENLIRKFCCYESLETAVNLLDQMLKKRSIPDSATYDCIVQSFCTCNGLDRAMDFYNEMLARNLKPSKGTWGALIEKFCVSGRTSEAEALLVSMVQLGESPTKQMYSSIIERYRLENNISKASELLQKMQQHGYQPDFTIQWSLISSLKSLTDQKARTGTQGFLSKLLHDSGWFPSGANTKSNLR